jgi:hypothetical protein
MVGVMNGPTKPIRLTTHLGAPGLDSETWDPNPTGSKPQHQPVDWLAAPNPLELPV